MGGVAHQATRPGKATMLNACDVACLAELLISAKCDFMPVIAMRPAAHPGRIIT
jgi:hypothetical protein